MSAVAGYTLTGSRCELYVNERFKEMFMSMAELTALFQQEGAVLPELLWARYVRTSSRLRSGYM